jgi:hypothetical protein
MSHILGENWIDENYYQSVIEPEIPGWELPTSWTEEDGDGKGPPNYGYITFLYTSDPSTGCTPIWAAREELTVTRCLAGTRGIFIRGLNVRPKSKVKKQNDDELLKFATLTRNPLYQTKKDYFESESDYFHDKCKDAGHKYYGAKANFQRAAGKF